MSKNSIENVIVETYKVKKNIDALNKQYNKYKNKIQKYFDENTNLEDSINAKGIIASKRQRVNITYDIVKLKKKLSKEIFNKIVDKTFIISDINGLVKLLKSKGIKYKEFMEFVNVNTVVNNIAINQAFEVGEITKDDLKGCFDAKITKYVDIRKEKDKN